MLDHSCQVQRHPNAERGVDLYETPPVATEALLRVEQIPQRIWEPAAGRGAIVRVLRDAGHTVIASDLIDYDFPLNTVGDFLKTTAMPAGCQAILTNPPFRWAEEFVAHALKLSPCDHVAAASVPGKRAAVRNPRGPWPCSHPCISKALADDAQRSVGGEEGQFWNGLRLVRLRPQSP